MERQGHNVSTEGQAVTRLSLATPSLSNVCVGHLNQCDVVCQLDLNGELIVMDTDGRVGISGDEGVGGAGSRYRGRWQWKNAIQN